MKDWPIYYKNLLLTGNPESSTGICTLWSERNKVRDCVSSDNFNTIGQGYSRLEGLNLIIRNCLANKKLHHLVLTGADLGRTGEALLNLKQKGISPDTREIYGIDKTQIEPEIPLEAIERFRENINIIDKRGSYLKLDPFLKTLPQLPAWGESEIYSRAPPTAPETFPSEEVGFTHRGSKLWNIWLNIVDDIMRFGIIKPSQYGPGQDQRELLNVTSILKNESTDPEEMILPDYLPFSKDDVRKYLPQVLTADGVVGVSYTYGERYYENFRGINQEGSIIKALKDSWFSRRGVATLWDVEKDHNNEHPPCLSLIQAIQQEPEKLHGIYSIRSNDMFRGYGENILAFRCSQEKIAKALDVELGWTIMNSGSAHIYENSWNQAKQTLEDTPPELRIEPDPRGNILINADPKGIRVTHLTPAGKNIGEFHASTAQKAYQEIARKKMASQPSHLLYIGTELQKAQTALELGIPYIQDKNLNLE